MKFIGSAAIRSLRAVKYSRALSSSTADSVHAPTVLFSWGIGTDGQLGHAKFEKTTTVLGEEYYQDEPRKMLKSKKFDKLAVGDNYTLGVTYDGELYGWGDGLIHFAGQKEATMEPFRLPFIGKVVGVAAGSQHAAIIDNHGLVHTWGNGGQWFRGGGQLGHGDTAKQTQPKLIQFLKDYGANITQVSCGEQHSIFLTHDGEVLGCGVGEYGRVGTGNSSDALEPTPIDTLNNEDIVQIAAGFDHSLALSSKGQVFGWGRNNNGQLGHSDSFIDIYSMEDLPRAIDNESILGEDNVENKPVVFKQVAAGNARSAAVTTDGRLYVWGARLSHRPKLVGRDLFDNLSVRKVVIGGDASHSVVAVITEDDGLWTLGDAASKMLGRPGLKGKHILPVRVPALKGKRVLDIYAGYGKHIFAKVEVTGSD